MARREAHPRTAIGTRSCFAIRTNSGFFQLMPIAIARYTRASTRDIHEVHLSFSSDRVEDKRLPYHPGVAAF
jgi:hypothetical protein